MSQQSLWIFISRFALIAPPIWILWWWVLPQYAWLMGQASGILISTFTAESIEAMRIVTDRSLFLNADTSITFTSRGNEYPFHITSLVATIPTILILIAATPGIKISAALRPIATSIAILALIHVAFIMQVFVWRNQIESAPQIPTALGYVILTIPFALWIVLTQPPTVASSQEDQSPTSDS